MVHVEGRWWMVAKPLLVALSSCYTKGNLVVSHVFYERTL